jgi:hypothetical protein
MMMMSVEQLMKSVAGEAELLGQNLPQGPPQIPHDLTQAQTWAVAVGRQGLTAGAMAVLLAPIGSPRALFFILPLPISEAFLPWISTLMIWAAHSSNMLVMN